VYVRVDGTAAAPLKKMVTEKTLKDE